MSNNTISNHYTNRQKDHKMTLEEIYKKYPCAKKKAEENIAFWDSDESLGEAHYDGELECAYRIHTGESELYKFFELIIHYDSFLLKQNEITPWEETKRNRIIEQLTMKHLGAWHDALYSSPKVDDYKLFLEDGDDLKDGNL